MQTTLPYKQKSMHEIGLYFIIASKETEFNGQTMPSAIHEGEQVSRTGKPKAKLNLELGLYVIALKKLADSEDMRSSTSAH